MDNVSMANAWHLEIIYTFFVPIVTSMSAIVLQRCACARAHTYDIDWQFWIQYIQSNIRTYRRATKRTHTRGREEERCTISWSYRNYSSLALVSSLSFSSLLSFQSSLPTTSILSTSVFIILALLVSLQLYHLNGESYLVLSSY